MKIVSVRLRDVLESLKKEASEGLIKKTSWEEGMLIGRDRIGASQSTSLAMHRWRHLEDTVGCFQPDLQDACD